MQAFKDSLVRLYLVQSFELNFELLSVSPGINSRS